MNDERARIGMQSFQSDDPHRLGGFWATVMGLDLLDAGPDPVMLDPDNIHGPTWLFQRADPARRTTTPRLRIDITSDTDDGWRALAIAPKTPAHDVMASSTPTVSAGSR